MAEQRLIEADALLKKLERMWDCTDMVFEPKELLCDPLGDCKGCKWKEILDFVKRIVKSIKAVDAVPVVHGHWEYGCGGYYSGIFQVDLWDCSNCGESSGYKSKYCPSCGACMDELKDGDESGKD